MVYEPLKVPSVGSVGGSTSTYDPTRLPAKPATDPLNPLSTVEPMTPRPPEDVAAAQKVFDDSLVALTEAQAGRKETSIPLSDTYWGVVDSHRRAYLALKDSIREIPISSPPDSDMKHDFHMAINSINAGEPRGTALSTILTDGINIPIENVPEEFQPFQRAQIPAGTKLVAAVEQPMEPAVINIPIPTPPIEEPPTEPVEPPVV